MTGSVFSSLIRSNKALSNLTSSINQLHNDGVIDGVELDWEWPVSGGEKKDRIKLIRYARVRLLHLLHTQSVKWVNSKDLAKVKQGSIFIILWARVGSCAAIKFYIFEALA